MKLKRVLLIGIVLGLLTALMLPGSVLAKQEEMSASGIITGISESTESPAGTSGRIVVAERSIYGTFTSGSLSGDFVMTYEANVDFQTQSGNLSGTLVADSFTFSVNGHIQPVQWLEVPDGYIGSITISGSWDLQTGDGNGTYIATLLFVPTPEGHVAYVLPGSTFES